MFTILGIDPGNNTGLAIIRIDENTLEIQDVKTLTLLLGNLIPTDVNNYYLRRKLTLISYLDNINKDFGIDVAGLETAFVNTKFPKSAITLSDYISCIELKLYDISPRIKLYKFPPKSVKALVGATGDATKEDMFNN